MPSVTPPTTTIGSPTGHLCVASELSRDSLTALALGEADIIWHAGFYPAARCEQALPAITKACEEAQYTLTSDLQSIGTSSGEAAESDANRERYLSTAAQTTALIRDEIFAGLLSPADRLRLLLDEYWPYGAHVARDVATGRHMLPGILRRWPQGGHANPHIDQTETSILAHLGITRRLGSNVYLQVPESGRGGEIELWDRIPETDYVNVKRTDYGLDRNSLGPPTYSLLPNQGDLVMFDASIIHGVANVEAGARVTSACFAGYARAEAPLVVFA
jgi:2OG-Fe(II) oxygenase superfamily